MDLASLVPEETRQVVPSSEGMTTICTFGPYRLDSSTGQLRRGDTVIPLAPKAFTVLQHLVTHAGQLITKDDLLELAWSDVHVGDGALKVCIREIRRTLQDDSEDADLHRNGAPARLPLHRAGLTRNAAGAAAWHDGRSVGRRRAGALGARDALRAQWRRQHRVSSRRQRPARSRVHHGLGLAPRLLLGRAIVRPFSSPPLDVLTADPDRQARHRPLRSRDRAADARTAHGRRPRGDGTGGLERTRR